MLAEFSAREVERGLRREITLGDAEEFAKQVASLPHIVDGINEIVTVAKAQPDAVAEWTYCMRLLESLRKLEEAGHCTLPMGGGFADTVLNDQKRRLQQYGATAYRLSDKQLDAIARQFVFPLHGTGEKLLGKWQGKPLAL